MKKTLLLLSVLMLSPLANALTPEEQQANINAFNAHALPELQSGFDDLRVHYRDAKNEIFDLKLACGALVIMLAGSVILKRKTV